MAKSPASPSKTRKGKRSAAAVPGPEEPAPAARTAAAKTPASAKTGKAARPARGAKAIGKEAAGKGTGKQTAKETGKAAKRSAGKSTKAAPGEPAAMPVVIQAIQPPVPLHEAALPAKVLPAKAGRKTGGKAGRKAGKGAAARRPARQTFLVAVTQPPDAEAPRLSVYAVVTRTPAEALSAVREHVGTDWPVGLTGKLSGRMAKALGLQPGEVRRI